MVHQQLEDEGAGLKQVSTSTDTEEHLLGSGHLTHTYRHFRSDTHFPNTQHTVKTTNLFHLEMLDSDS
jgi:hypothetical protein